MFILMPNKFLDNHIQIASSLSFSVWLIEDDHNIAFIIQQKHVFAKRPMKMSVICIMVPQLLALHRNFILFSKFENFNVMWLCMKSLKNETPFLKFILKV